MLCDVCKVVGMYCGCLLFFAKGRGGVVYHTQVTALRRRVGMG